MKRSTLMNRELIRRAHRGDRAALGELMQRFRPWLKIWAQRELGGELGKRVSASDLVQKTMLSVVRNFPQFRGSEEAELLAWIRQVHRRGIRDTIRDHVLVQKRSVTRDGPLQGRAVDALPEHGSRQLSPLQRLMLGEDALKLSQALEKLPEDQGEAVRLRHLEGLSLAELTEHFGRSRPAVAGLLQRGLQNLRKALRDPGSQSK